MNKNQKLVLVAASVLVILSLAVWQAYGGEVFTKTQVLVEVQDEIERELGISHKEWRDKFVLGLDYTMAFIGVVFASSVLLLFLLRTKKTETLNA